MTVVDWRNLESIYRNIQIDFDINSNQTSSIAQKGRKENSNLITIHVSLARFSLSSRCEVFTMNW